MTRPRRGSGANTAERVPTTTSTSPRRMRCHWSWRSPIESALCWMATRSPNDVAEERRHRRRQRDLGHQQQHLTAGLQHEIRHTQVDLGLAAAGDAVQQRHVEAGGHALGQRGDSRRLLVRQRRDRRHATAGGAAARGKGSRSTWSWRQVTRPQRHQARHHVARRAALAQLSRWSRPVAAATSSSAARCFCVRPLSVDAQRRQPLHRDHRDAARLERRRPLLRRRAATRRQSRRRCPPGSSPPPTGTAPRRRRQQRLGVDNGGNVLEVRSRRLGGMAHHARR